MMIRSPIPIYTPGGEDTVRVIKRLAQEHNIVAHSVVG